jgi:hypothetical protein
MSENIEKFPLPLKEELPLDESPSPQSPGVVRHSGIVPWAHYPQGTTIIVIGGDRHLSTPPVPETLPTEEDNTYRMERRNLSYLSYILSSWQRAVIALANLSPEIPTFPALAQVWEMNSSANKKYIIYEHAGVEWRSSYHVKIENNKQKLIIHLANDGFLYFNPFDLEVENVTNDRHRRTTPSGWKVFKTGTAADSVKEKLADFRAFAVDWFGTDAIRQSVLYNPSCWKIDICFQSKENGVGLEFSFQADWPVAEEHWSD